MAFGTQATDAGRDICQVDALYGCRESLTSHLPVRTRFRRDTLKTDR